MWETLYKDNAKMQCIRLADVLACCTSEKTEKNQIS